MPSRKARCTSGQPSSELNSKCERRYMRLVSSGRSLFPSFTSGLHSRAIRSATRLTLHPPSTRSCFEAICRLLEPFSSRQASLSPCQVVVMAATAQRSRSVSPAALARPSTTPLRRLCHTRRPRQSPRLNTSHTSTPPRCQRSTLRLLMVRGDHSIPSSSVKLTSCSAKGIPNH